jgi:hypothetical protein
MQIALLLLAAVTANSPALVRYFPPDVPADVETQWAPFLAAAGERPLAVDPARRLYRLTYRPSWRPPIVVIAELRAGLASLRVKVLDGQGAVRPGRLAREYSRRLASAEWEKLSEALKAGFWAQGTAQQRDPRTVDGSACMIEGIRWGEYHVAVGLNPVSNPFRAACRAVLDLTWEDIPVTDFAEVIPP